MSVPTGTPTKAGPVEVPLVSVEKIVVDAPAALEKLAGISRLPLSKARLVVELKGVPTAFANALRRAAMDEMRGRALTVGKAIAESGTTDPFMFDQFVCGRIELIPLRPRVATEVIKNVQFAVHVENKTASTMAVYSGDMVVVKGTLTEPIFNPTFEIAFLQPGHAIHIENITIAEGTGREHGMFQVARRAALRHLDVKELPRSETHAMGAAHADESGYEASSMLADPRHHEVTLTIPAVGDNPAEAVSVAVDACVSIKERLRLIENALGASFTLTELEGGLAQGVLWVAGETATVGNMLARVVHEQVHDVSYVGYTCVPHENGMRLTVRHAGDVAAIVARALRHCHETFDAIQQKISAAKVAAGKRA